MTKRSKRKDPHAAREAKKYDKPVASREFILSIITAHKESISLQELCDELKVTEAEQVEAIRRRLRAMIRDGQLEQLPKRRYWLSGKRVLVKGTVTVDKKNMLWVIPDDRSARIALPYFTDQKVLSGNKIIVSVPDTKDNNKAREGKLVEIISQPDVIITGRFVLENNVNFVIPFSKEFVHDIIIPPGQELNAKNGQIVVVEIITQESNRLDPVGKIIEILGDDRNKDVEIQASIRRYHLSNVWPVNVLKDIEKYSEEIPKAAYSKRVDLRNLPLVTIDGEDARDFDDAVYCELKKSGGWKLYVAIADVSHYVKVDSALDQEAFNRGNSVYFPTRVIPMLPEILSNGLCSLKPSVDRLCMVCEMNISKEGKLGKYTFYPAVMHSKARLTYNKVAKILDKDKVLCAEYKPLVRHLEHLHDLYKALRKEREERGAIDFETIETGISFGKNGEISQIVPLERNVAHKIIEECMLCANVATAKFLRKNKIPSLYRNHEAPPEDKLSDLKTFLKELGLSLGVTKGNKPKPLDYGRLLQKIKDRKDARMIQIVLLRSLSQAVYAPDNLGHFGLAYQEYTHFTSPIRRYPDLVIHRLIKIILAGKWDLRKKTDKFEKKLEEIAHHCSVTERRADDATRDVISSLKCQYIKKYIGSVFDGVISGVTSFGLFVELTDLYVDGLVHIASIGNDYYIYEPIHHKLIGEKTGVTYSLGMPVKVRVVKVNTDEQKIDFDLVEKPREIRKANKKSKKLKRQKTKKRRK